MAKSNGKTVKAKSEKGNGKAATGNEQRDVTAADLEALGIATETSKALGGSRYPTISVEKIGFQVKNETGVQAMPSFDGIILHEHPLRTYYASADVGNQPPDCYSPDGVTGSAFGSCASCQHRFQAAANRARAQGLKKPNEQYCRDKHAVYVALEPGGAAHLLRIPTMSLSRWQLFTAALKTQGKALAQVWTTFSVTTRKNAAGQPYGECNFLPGKGVALAELKQLAPQAKMLRESAATVAQIPETAGSSASQDNDSF